MDTSTMTWSKSIHMQSPADSQNTFISGIFYQHFLIKPARLVIGFCYLECQFQPNCFYIFALWIQMSHVSYLFP